MSMAFRGSISPAWSPGSARRSSPPYRSYLAKGARRGTNMFAEGDQGFLWYFEGAYIGRRVAAGRRNPLPDHSVWNVEIRISPGSLRTDSATEPFINAFSEGVAQADRPSVYRFTQSLKIQRNISSGATRAARCSATIDRPRGR